MGTCEACIWPAQAVHHPHEAPPAWLAQGSDIDSYRGMLWGTDIYVGQLTTLLRDKKMWDDTFIVFVSTYDGAAAPPGSLMLRTSHG